MKQKTLAQRVAQAEGKAQTDKDSSPKREGEGLGRMWIIATLILAAVMIYMLITLLNTPIPE